MLITGAHYATLKAFLNVTSILTFEVGKLQTRGIAHWKALGLLFDKVYLLRVEKSFSPFLSSAKKLSIVVWSDNADDSVTCLECTTRRNNVPTYHPSTLVYTDGSSYGNPGPAGAGFLIDNSSNHSFSLRQRTM